MLMVIFSITAGYCIAGHDAGTNNMEDIITKMTYRYTDSSVPPEYHRSYTLAVTPSNVHVVVDSYGDVLAEKDISLRSGQFDLLIRSLKESGIKNTPPGEENGCVGGTSETLTVHSQAGKIVSGTVYLCGGEKSGNISGDVDRVADDIRSLVPDLKNLLK